MGYYDQDYQEPPRRQKGNRGGSLLAGITGAILGGLIVLFAGPTVNDFVNGNFQHDENKTGTNEPAGPEKQVSVNVSSDITNIVSRVSSSVVGVINIQQSGFWEEEEGSGEAGTGSGVIYKKAGGNAFVVTNHHVIEGATQVEISLSDGTRIKARILGSDKLTDLAVLQVSSDKIKNVAPFGDSDKVKPGEPSIAIGNPLGLQFAGSVTQGIISGTERAIPIDENGDGQPDWNSEVIQTDAAINPGNSGGALINIDGKVIGINSMKIAESSVEGIGLAIPVNIAKPVIEDLEKYGEVRRPFLGLSMRSLDEVSSYHQQETLKLPKSVTKGVVVFESDPISPAGKAGIKQMDVITQMDGKDIKDIIELRKVLYELKPGDTISITYYRSGKKQSVDVRLGESQAQGS
ncbi:trypsin-like peptidase domain-containing protein [Metabacillus sp. KIGAM252]|uniref:Trypsin-like peptidase domain-containing protein n=1 Tax=Metabacillus flavus TaxID=2823519 RepID=A0ABS5LJZ1_9BACI|nr:trypsin-like peptidase domain-containing protein [Metabacillus flavus]MBS2971072.1 trypsin-like peptidase domain-containing protein [Metabacillus flavus]